MTNIAPQNEEWKSIFGYEGLYEISNYGRVKSLPRIGRGKRECFTQRLKGKEVQQHIMNTGYYACNLRKEGKHRLCTTHRLLAIAFIPNPKQYPVINHINGIRSDNRLENLEWCTCAHNQRHRFVLSGGARSTPETAGKYQKSGKAATTSKGMWRSTCKPINQFAKNGELVKRWNAGIEAYNAGYKGVVAVLKGRAEYHKGFKWDYAEDKK